MHNGSGVLLSLLRVCSLGRRCRQPQLQQRDWRAILSTTAIPQGGFDSDRDLSSHAAGRHHRHQSEGGDHHDGNDRRRASSEEEKEEPSSTRAANAVTKALLRGTKTVVVPFELGPEEAVRKFESYQRATCKGFQVPNLVHTPDLAPTLIPFWAFSATYSARYSCRMGWKKKDDGGKDPSQQGKDSMGKGRDDGGDAGPGEERMSWERSGWRSLVDRVTTEGPSSSSLSSSSPSSSSGSRDQPSSPLWVCASYSHPRQLVDGLFANSKGGGGGGGGRGAGGGRPLSLHEARSLYLDNGEPHHHRRPRGEVGHSLSPSSSPGVSSASSPSSSSTSQSSSRSGGVPIEDPEMPQGLAWHLATRVLTRRLIKQAESAAKEGSKDAKGGGRGGEKEDVGTGVSRGPPDGIKDLQVDLQVHTRSATLVFLPAYLATYVHGSRCKQGTSGVIIPHTFHALIGATSSSGEGGGVSATAHLSPVKVGGLAGLGTFFLGSLLGSAFLATTASPFSPASLPSVVAVAVVAAAAAGSWARGRPQASKNQAQVSQALEDRSFYAQYDRLQSRFQEEEHREAAAAAAAEGGEAAEEGAAKGDGKSRQGESEAQAASSSSSSPSSSLATDEAYMLWLWSETDWRRWENEEPWNWDPKAKKKEAEALWRQQLARPIERRRQKELRRLAAEQQRQDEEESASRHRHSSHHHASHQDSHSQGGWRRRRGHHLHAPPTSSQPRDFLGYYRALGIDVSTAFSGRPVQPSSAFSGEGEPGQGTPPAEVDRDLLIKASFKTQAMILHPDKQVDSTEEEKRIANVKFQKLQMAYDVLRDPAKREAYDKGQLVH